MSSRPSYPAERLDFALPPELIAQHPTERRRDSRLLHIDVASGRISDRSFSDLPELLPQSCLIIMNDSRVIPARLFGNRLSGGRVEVMYHSSEAAGRFRVLMKSRARLAAGEVINLPDGWTCQLLEPKQLDGSLVLIRDATGAVASTGGMHAFLEQQGVMPLPPYIHRSAGEDLQHSPQDRERYQTVYAARAGSVAAPTAGLHFDNDMLDQLRHAGHDLEYLTLHVGMGTFAPLRVSDLADHEMHSEDYSVSAGLLDSLASAREAARPVMAVGTTSLRVLHTLLQENPAGHAGESLHASTRAFIYPGQPTAAAELLLTNFHLPRSSLLALVYSFGGEELMRAAYIHAVEQQYRFFSYGDCMLIDRRNSLL